MVNTLKKGSRKAVHKKTPAVTTRVLEAVKTAAENFSAARLLGSVPRLPTVVVAFSGGLDSVVLTHAASRLKGSCFERVVAVHVHHGLSENADSWAASCEKQAKKFGIDFRLCKVQVPKTKEGTEATARKLRYDALEKAAREEGAEIILTAHHLDDQIETFLIQWMRGAGLDGLASMPLFKKRKNITIVRPFLQFKRDELEEYAAKKRLSWVEDESNADTAYLRNALRHNVIPRMEEARPGFKRGAQRSITLVAEAAEILRETAEEDLEEVLEVDTGFILLDRFLKLSPSRQTLLVKLWIEEKGMKSLPRSRLLEMIRQVKETGRSSVLLYTSNNKELRLYGARLMIVEKQKAPEPELETEIRWHGEGSIDLPLFGGRLEFRKNPKGFNETYLKSQPLLVKTRSGSAKLKIHPFRPSKTLKVLYKEAHIPEFERNKLPIIWRAGKLIYAAKLGEEIREKLDDDGSEKYSLEFVKDRQLL